jgi:lysophospholipase L1-like esterase
MKATLRAALVTSLTAAVFAMPAFAQPAAPAAPAAPATAPASRPVYPPPTPEQQKFIDETRRQPTDVPAVKLDLRPFNQDGSANRNYSKPDIRFMQMHAEFVARSKQPAQVVFIGDSITAGWRNGGQPKAPRDIWQETFGKYQPANFGIGGDGTQHVLWRIENGELDAWAANPPKVAVVMIGTNNTGKTSAEIAAGTTAVVKAVRAKLPQTKVLLLAIFPRGADANNGARRKLGETNAILAKLDDGQAVRYLDIGPKFLTADGTLTKEIMPDFLHPSPAGYQIWADAIAPVLEEMTK